MTRTSSAVGLDSNSAGGRPARGYLHIVHSCTLAALFLLSAAQAYGQDTCPSFLYTRIADTDTVVPGGNGGKFIALSLSDPAVTRDQVAFRGEGGGAEGIFAGNGVNLTSLASVGDAIAGGGTVAELFDDFSVGEGVADVILRDSNGVRGIYTTSGGPLTKVVQFGEPSPSGGSFSTIFFVARDRENLAFEANVSFAQAVNGVFARIAGTNQTVADSTVPMPGIPNTTLGSFSDPDISGENVTFRAGRGANIGVYARVDGLFTKVVDDTDTQAGTNKLFQTFTTPVIDGGQVAFRALGDFTAIYAWQNGALEVVAKSGDAAPGSGTFSGFAQNVAIDEQEIAFSGAGSGFQALFVSGHSGLCKVIDTNDSLDGKDLVQVFMGRDSYVFGRLGFRAVFSDGSRGIFLATAVHQPGQVQTNPSSGNSFFQGLLMLLLDE